MFGGGNGWSIRAGETSSCDCGELWSGGPTIRHSLPWRQGQGGWYEYQYGQLLLPQHQSAHHTSTQHPQHKKNNARHLAGGILFVRKVEV